MGYLINQGCFPDCRFGWIAKVRLLIQALDHHQLWNKPQLLILANLDEAEKLILKTFCHLKSACPNVNTIIKGQSKGNLWDQPGVLMAHKQTISSICSCIFQRDYSLFSLFICYRQDGKMPNGWVIGKMCQCRTCLELRAWKASYYCKTEQGD